MYQLLTFISGILTAIMVSFNGGLSEVYGIYLATVIIHVVGSFFALIIKILRKDQKGLFNYGPKWIYLGGVIGVSTTVFANIAYGNISMTSIIALGLLGQLVTSLIVDRFGLMGMEKRPFQPTSLIGLLFSLGGVLIMLDTSVTTAVIAVAVSFFSGISIVLSRTVNAHLAEKVGALNGSLINHLTGLPVSIILALIMSKQFSTTTLINNQPFSIWIYLGGILGVVMVMLNNVVVPQVSAFRITILTFVGQVLTGVLLDLTFGNSVSDASFQGGVLIAVGVLITMVAEQFFSLKTKKRASYDRKIKDIEEIHQKEIAENFIERSENEDYQ